MKFNKKAVGQIDMLAEKQAKLQHLKSQADNAIHLVTQTINDLEYTNQEIDATVDEIDDYIANLSTTRNALDKNRKYNTAIIANFSKLLEVSEVD
jgi:cytolysin (calcineurin-like family phosphatase)